ncbi:T9SS type A sorting domain-containing protein [bacterium]|nr:T9SS type A sorting domain-containing protein [bacterium]
MKHAFQISMISALLSILPCVQLHAQPFDLWNMEIMNRSLDYSFGNPSKMMAYGDYLLHAGAYSGVSVLDVSNPLNPVLVTEIEGGRTVQQFAVHEHYLYLVFSGFRPLVVYDLSDITQPVLLAELNYMPWAPDVLEVINGHLFMIEYNQGLWVYDLANPTAPQVVYQNGSFYFQELSVSGDILYGIQDNGSSIAALDISNLSQIHELDHQLAYSTYHLTSVPGVVYLTAGSEIGLIDATDPTNLGTPVYQDLDRFAAELLVTNNTLVVGGQDTHDDFLVYDISTPLNPTRTATLTQHQSELLVSHTSNPSIIYTTGDMEALSGFDISDPHNPSFLGTIGYRSSLKTLDYRDGLLALACAYNGFWISDWRDPDNPQDYHFFLEARVADAQFVGDYLYVAVRGGYSEPLGLYVFDISDPANPMQIRLFQGRTNEFSVSGDVLYRNTGSEIEYWDISDPGDPQYVADVNGFSESDRVIVEGDRIYAVYWNTLRAYSIDDPANPVLQSTVDIDYDPSTDRIEQQFMVSDGRIAIAQNDHRLTLVDASGPELTVAAELFDPNSLRYYGSSIYGHYLYASPSEGGIYVYNIADMTHPVLVASLEGPDWSNRVVATDSTGWAIIGTRLYQLDLSSFVSTLVPPSNLTAQHSGDDQVLLEWNPPQGGGDVLEYRIYRNGAQVGTSGVAVYTDTMPGFGFFTYKVTAVYNLGETEASNPAYVNWDAAITLDLIPFEPSQTVPPYGNRVYFNAGITNTLPESITLDAWTEVTFPGGATMQLAQYVFDFHPNVPFVRNWLSFRVPARAPAGDYTFTAKLGVRPDMIVSDDSFPFTKIAISSNAAVAATTIPALPDEPFEDPWVLKGWLSPATPPDESSCALATDAFSAGDDQTESASLPTEFAVSAYPNPFNERATITISLPESGEVTAQMYDITGRRVATLLSGSVTAGTHQLAWDADGLASGVYFLRVQTDGYETVIRKLALVR